MIEVVFDADVQQAGFPPLPAIERAVAAACQAAGFSMQPELCVRFASDEAVRSLNRQWRGLDKVTDVLSFPMQEGPAYDLGMSLGDIALAAGFIHQQARSLGLSVQNHSLHLIIHAVLHLLGFDHESETPAAGMQQIEQEIMAQLGLHDPYPDQVTVEQT